MLFMLDTNLCIYAIKHRPPEVLAALRRHETDGLGVSSITVAELFFGVAKSGSLRNRLALQQYLEPLEIADFDRAAAAGYGPLRDTQEAAWSTGWPRPDAPGLAGTQMRPGAPAHMHTSGPPPGAGMNNGSIVTMSADLNTAP